MSTNDSSTAIRTVDDGDLCTDIVTAVAEVNGVDPTEIETPLYHVVDPDALERLYSDGADARSRTTFVYEGCEVVVRGDGLVLVSGIEGATVPTPRASTSNNAQQIKMDEEGGSR